MVFAVVGHLSASFQPEALSVNYYRGEVDARGQFRGPKVQVSSGQPMSPSGSFVLPCTQCHKRKEWLVWRPIVSLPPAV